MPPIDALTAFLDQPVWLAYGKLGPIAGNIPILHELSDKKKVAATLVGAGPWDDIERIWASRKVITLPDTTRVHFHRGEHGEIGVGMTPSSNGGDQKVDNFFSDLPAGLDKVTFSGYAHTFLKLDPDPGAPGPELEILAHYKALRVRIFDAAGAQTSFAFSENPAWWIHDFLLRKLVKRHSRFNEPLTADEKARVNWTVWDAAAADLAADADFNTGGITWREPVDAQAALEDLLWFSRCFLLEVDGKFELYFDKDRAASMTLYLGDIEPGSFRANKSQLRGARNQITVKFRDNGLASGSSDELTRYAIVSTEQLNHRSHQRATGARGPGLAVLPNVQPLVFDYAEGRAVCCAKPARMWRLAKHHLARQLGDETAPDETYVVPFDVEFVAAERTLKLLPGDIVTIDKSISEEFGGTDYEVLRIRQLPDGRRRMSAKQKVAVAYPATAPAQQATQAPAPGAGLAPTDAVDSGGNTFLDPDKYVNSAVREESTTARSGQTSSTAWTTVASFTKKITQPIVFKGSLRCTKTADPTSTFGPSFATGGSDQGGLDVAWQSPGNIVSSNDVYAQVNLLALQSSNALRATFDFNSIPAGQDVLGVEIRVERKATGLGAGKIRDKTVRLVRSGSPVGTNKADTATDWPTADTLKSYGGAADLWGTTWSLSEVAALAVDVAVNEVNNVDRSALIDAIQATVYTDGGTYTMKARLKIGAALSSEISITEPTTTNTQEVSVSGVNPSAPNTPTAITIEVQAQVTTTNGGTVESEFSDVKFTDQAPVNVGSP